jgi:hypothetical protein
VNFNKGEWSELYTFLYLFKNSNLVIVDENIKPIENNIFQILEIILSDKKYEIKENEIIKISTNEERYKIEDISKSLYLLFKKIVSQKSSKGSFEIPEIKSIIDSLFDGKKIKGNSREKGDLEANVLDKKQNRKVSISYNIKSNLGAKATLLNASQHTNFIYEIKNINESIMKANNSIFTRTKLLDRCNYLISKGTKFEFLQVESEVFAKNLKLVDTKLDEVLAEMLLLSYTKNEKDIEKLIEFSTKSESDKIYFRKKLGDFANAVTFGMRASEEWSGYNEVNGGILLVEKDGDIYLLDLIYFKNLVDKYLIKNIKLDSPSFSRYKMFEVFKKDDKFYFKFTNKI